MSISRRTAMLRDERGFTLIEVMMAAVMLVAIIGAASALFIHGNDSSIAVQRQSQLISVADQQIEMIRQDVKTEGFNRLAMSGVPVALPSGFPNTSIDSTTKADPSSFALSLTGCGASNEEYLIESNYDNTAENQPKNPQNTTASGVTPFSGCTNTTTQVGEPLEILSNGFVPPQQASVTVGSDTAVVDTYVTDSYVGCNSGGFSGCPTVTSDTVSCSTWPTTTTSTACGDARRVTVAVVLNDHGRFDTGPSAPVYVSSVFTNPTPSNTPTNSIGLTLGVQLG
jgi:prepilin-type N-terminal cleavage/methylation domain-containing protein